MEEERLATVNESDLDGIIKEKDAKNTQKATIFACRKFRVYLISRTPDFSTPSGIILCFWPI